MRRRLTWAAAIIGALALMSSVALAARRGAVADARDLMELAGVLAFAAGFGSVGLVLALRRPDHPVGWLLLAFGVVSSARLFFEELAHIVDGAALAWSTFFVNALVGPMVGLLVAVAITFPNGWPTTRFWRGALAVVAAAAAVAVLAAPFVGYDTGASVLSAPLVRIDALEGVEFLTGLVMFGVGFIALVRLVLLLFRGDEVASHQIRWVAYTVVVAIAVLALELVVPGANVAAGIVAGVGIPLSLAVAITRYRLYEIDRVVNRTVVYAIVVGLLAALFAIGAIWVPSLLPFEDNNLAVAASTLAVAAAFSPLRKGVQRFVDRRFYRSRYDAQQVADELSSRLRDQLDPDDVAADWVDVVQRTLQPETVAVWVRE